MSNFQFSKLLNKIYPLPPIGGLEISDTSIRLTEFVKGNPSVQAYRLPKGVVEGGRVKNKAALVAVLKEMTHKSPNKGKLGIVLTLPAAHVFIQTVKLPPAARSNLEEAAALNVQMVSPLKQGEFYFDWQKVRETEAGPIELLAAFVSREIVDEVAECLQEAGLSLVAVEFTSLSLLRELVRRKAIEAGNNYLAVEITADGTTFMLIQDNQLLFHSFHALISGAAEISVTDFIKTLTEEIHNMVNFHLSHWGRAVDHIIFISAGLKAEIGAAFKDKMPTILNPKEAAPATGAAIRRILGEKEINLLGTSSLKVYEANRALTFVSLWRTVFVSALGFLLILALGADLFLRQLAKKEAEANALVLTDPGHRELVTLREEAARFNELVALIKEARQDKQGVGEIAAIVNNLAGVEINISHFYLASMSDPVTVSGVAASEQAAVAFKNRLAGEKSFSQVDLPISSILPATSGKVSFTIYLKIAETEL